MASPIGFPGNDNHMVTTSQLPNGLPGGSGTWPGNGIYDAAGGVINDGVTTYTYDAEGRVCALNGPQGMIGYQYDAAGNRVGKGSVTTIATCDITQNGCTPMSDFVLDQSGGQVTEMSITSTASGSTSSANLLTGRIDERFSRTDSLGSMSFLTDALGSTVALSNASGALQAQYSYDPYGNIAVSGPFSSNSYTYTGRESDGLGIYYYRARYYNPGMERFISEDPLGFAGSGPNLYEYADDSPTNVNDPFGLFPTDPVAPNNHNPGGVSDKRMQCESNLLAKGALHATATAVGNIKGTWTKLMGGLKVAAPSIGVYSEAGATFLGAGAETAAIVGSSLSGAAEIVGAATTIYVVGSGVVDFYKYVTDPNNSCNGIP